MCVGELSSNGQRDRVCVAVGDISSSGKAVGIIFHFVDLCLESPKKHRAPYEIAGVQNVIYHPVSAAVLVLDILVRGCFYLP